MQAQKNVPDLVLGISDLVRFTPIWSDLVIRVTHLEIAHNSVHYIIQTTPTKPHNYNIINKTDYIKLTFMHDNAQFEPCAL